MAIIITNQANTIKFDLGNSEEHHIDKDNLSVKKKFGFVHVHSGKHGADRGDFTKLKFRYTDVSDPVLASNTELVNLILGYKVNTGVTIGNVIITDDTGNLMTLEPNGSIPVTLQDQTTPVIIAPMSLLEQSTTTSANVAIDDRTVTLTSVTGVSAGKLLTFFNPTSVRFMTAYVIGAPAGNVVTLDRYFDFAYPSGSYVDVGDTNMVVAGSAATPIRFGIRNNAGAIPPPGIELTMDVTRMIFELECTALPEADLFGDIAALTNGIFCRRRDGAYYNIFNIKSNGELAGIMYDFTQFDATKQGTQGFRARLTFAGQNKLGVTVRLAINEDLEVFVQDDLTTDSSITSFKITSEGSLVLD